MGRADNPVAYSGTRDNDTQSGILQPNLDRLGIKSDVERAFHAYTTYSPFTLLASFLHVVNNTR